jgi:hypothetical protein
VPCHHQPVSRSAPPASGCGSPTRPPGRPVSTSTALARATRSCAPYPPTPPRHAARRAPEKQCPACAREPSPPPAGCATSPAASPTTPTSQELSPRRPGSEPPRRRHHRALRRTDPPGAHQTSRPARYHPQAAAALARAAAAAREAWAGWRAVAHAWDTFSTGTNATLTPAAAEISDLVLWVGRLAHRDPAWIPARGHTSLLRETAGLARRSDITANVLAALHHAVYTLANIGAGEREILTPGILYLILSLVALRALKEASTASLLHLALPALSHGGMHADGPMGAAGGVPSEAAPGDSW